MPANRGPHPWIFSKILTHPIHRPRGQHTLIHSAQSSPSTCLNPIPPISPTKTLPSSISSPPHPLVLPTASEFFPSQSKKRNKMLLKTPASSISLLFSARESSLLPPRTSPAVRIGKGRHGGAAVVAMAAANSSPLTGVVFDPFKELKEELGLVPTSLNESLARQRYADDCEAAINEQINVEYNVSYVYHAMFAYFDRDYVAFKGLAKFFKESSEEEREHAEKLMEYQNMRGGRVKLLSITAPITEFDHAEKGAALHAMELALSLEKLTNEKLLNLHGVASRCGDPQLTDFVEGEFLAEQVEAIKKISGYVAQLRRIGNIGHGVWHFDQMLLHEGDAA